MVRLKFVVVFIVILAISPAGYPDQASAAYKKGVHAESQKQYDAAYESYKQAYTLKPNDAKYAMAYLHSRAYAAAQHIANGQKLRDSLKLQEALAEFQRAAEIDSTNFVASQKVSETLAALKKQAESGSVAIVRPVSPLAKLAAEAEGPVELQPSPNAPITMRVTNTADYIYRSIGKVCGINVLFDLDYKPQKITVELNEVMPLEALKMVALESKTFWRAISPNAIFVAAEAKRKDFESSVMKTFYLRNASTPTELQDVVGALKGMLEINRIQVNPTMSSITMRATPDQLVLAEKLISDADKAKAEVVIDIAVMEISRDLLKDNWGTSFPTSTSITPLGPSSGSSSGSGTGTVVNLGHLNGTSWQIPIPGATFALAISDSNAKILQRPQVRALDNEKATLRIGDRIPIATGSFAAGIGGGGISPLVNTQFQYIDVGVNIDITPHIHSDRDVTLKMVLEITSPGAQVNLGGITQPEIGQRRIEQEARLQDGEVNLVGGILTENESHSLTGLPWVTKVPILKYLFGQESKDRHQSEVVFAITPHIVRAGEITDENLRMIDVGTNNNIGLRYKESKPAKAKEPASPPPNPSPAQGSDRRQSGAQGNPTSAPKASAGSGQ